MGEGGGVAFGRVFRSQLNIPEEVCLAIKVKYMIGIWRSLGREEYVTISDHFDGGEKNNMTTPVVYIIADTEESSTSNSSRRIVGLKVKRSKKAAKTNVLTIMKIYRRKEERVHDHREKVEDSREIAKDHKKLAQVIVGITSGYFTSEGGGKEEEELNWVQRCEKDGVGRSK